MKLNRTTILTPTQFRWVLSNSTPDILPLVVLGGFCGLRLGEIQNLDWSNVDFEKHILEFGGKYPSRNRLVSLPDAAAAWLKPIAKKSGRVIDNASVSTLAARMFRVWKKAKLERSPQSLRLSAIAYRFAIDGKMQTACEFGISPKIIANHFLKPVTEDEAKAWFSIFPPN